MLLNRMKEENENRVKIISSLEGNSGSLFTGNIKISTLGSFGEIYDDDTESTQDQIQAQSSADPEEEDALSVKSL